MSGEATSEFGSSASSSASDSGSYIVLFAKDAKSVSALARQVIRDVGGVEKYVWEGAVKGFAVRGLSPAMVAVLQRHPGARFATKS